MNSAVRIQMTALISRNLPAATFTSVYEISPKLSPVAMLNVSGVATSVTNAGIASVNSFHSTRAECRQQEKARDKNIAEAGSRSSGYSRRALDVTGHRRGSSQFPENSSDRV